MGRVKVCLKQKRGQRLDGRRSRCRDGPPFYRIRGRQKRHSPILDATAFRVHCGVFFSQKLYEHAPSPRSNAGRISDLYVWKRVIEPPNVLLTARHGQWM